MAPGEVPLTTSALAERLGITPGSVSAMLKKLDELGLVAREPSLTANGRSLEVIRHHRLLDASSPRCPRDAVGSGAPRRRSSSTCSQRGSSSS